MGLHRSWNRAVVVLKAEEIRQLSFLLAEMPLPVSERAGISACGKTITSSGCDQCLREGVDGRQVVDSSGQAKDWRQQGPMTGSGVAISAGGREWDCRQWDTGASFVPCSNFVRKPLFDAHKPMLQAAMVFGWNPIDTVSVLGAWSGLFMADQSDLAVARIDAYISAWKAAADACERKYAKDCAALARE